MRVLCLFLVLALSICTINAQISSVVSSSDHYENTSHQLDWSIGELLIEKYTNSSFQLTSGFYQYTYLITVIDKLDFVSDSFDIYPNPTNDIIKLKYDKALQFNCAYYSLYDLHGHHIISDQIIHSSTIDFKLFPPGIYLITIRTATYAVIKSFQIIKY